MIFKVLSKYTSSKYLKILQKISVMKKNRRRKKKEKRTSNSGGTVILIIQIIPSIRLVKIVITTIKIIIIK